MYYLIYLSAATKWFTEDELKELLDISYKNNSRDNITGLLLYSEGSFIQLLEGDEADVQTTFRRISADQRHKGIAPVASGNIDQRNFPEWAMGYKSVNAQTLLELKGFLDPNQKDFLADKDKHIATNLLKAFVRTARKVS